MGLSFLLNRQELQQDKSETNGSRWPKIRLHPSRLCFLFAIKKLGGKRGFKRGAVVDEKDEIVDKKDGIVDKRDRL